ncbi:Retrovirus-related Pol polyprotein from transposon 17.6, partial [Mucuna pruriens]
MGKPWKTSFQALEIVGTTSVEEEKGTSKPSKAAIMAAKILINNGFELDKGLGKKLDGIAKLVKIQENLGRAGLSYNETTKKGKPRSKVPGKRQIQPNLYQYFNNGGIMIPEQVATVENQSVEPAEWVHPMAPDIETSFQIDNATFTSNDVGKSNRQEEEEDIEEETLRELERLLEQEGSKLQSGAEELEVINLNEGEGVKEIRVGKLILPDVKQGLIELLREYADIFMWSYQDMPGLDTIIFEHRLPLNLDAIPVRDLNRASPKDNFPLPHIDLFVDNTSQHSCYSFMDGFFGYNQIQMTPENKEKTTFITTWGTFYYKVMPFGLKNAGATYQRAMVTLFHDMIHKEVEQHINDLRKLFERLRKYQLRLNSAKCIFGVRTGKLLGFIINERGIELDSDKVKAIRNMPAPKSEKEVRGLLGRYLESPPVLVPAVPGRPLILYLNVLKESMEGILGQLSDFGKEQAIYYLSKKFTEFEQRANLLCFGLGRKKILVIHAGSYYMAYCQNRPLKYIFKKPTLIGRIARWQMALLEYDIVYTSQKGVKGSALAEQLAHHPLDEYHPVSHEFPDEHILMAEENKYEAEVEGWKLWFDGASNLLGNGIGAVLASPLGQYFPFSTRLGFECTNNMAEYEACAMGITLAIEHQVGKLKLFSDSALVIYQLRGEWET